MFESSAMSISAEVAVLGDRYLSDPSVAPYLLEKLVELPDGGAETCIDQKWLDIHWDQPCAIDMLVAITDFWDRQPEPLSCFLQTCWARNDPAWHHFIHINIVEDDYMYGADGGLSHLMYQRFVAEGPTDDVIDSMYFLSASLDSDRFALPVLLDILNRGMVQNPCRKLLKLWRRYNVIYNVSDDAMTSLKAVLTSDELANDAIRVVECLRMHDIPGLLPDVVALANSATCQASRRARRVLVGLSDSHLAKSLAHAVSDGPWHIYMRRFHYKTMMQRKMVAFLVQNNLIDVAVDLWNDLPATSLQHGVFTAILEMDPCWYTRFRINERPDLVAYDPGTTDDIIYYMYMHGQPPPDQHMFRKALRSKPGAVQTIAMRAPLVKKELCWSRRRGLLMALCANTKTHLCKKAKGSVLLRLASCEYCWPVVFKYL